MTLAEALAIAEAAKPKSDKRVDFNKLHTGKTDAGQFAADAAALTKRFDGMAHTASVMTAQVEQLVADLDHIENFPGHPRRLLH